MTFLKNEKIKNFDNEIIYFKKKKYFPHYSTKESYHLFKKVINKINKNKLLKKKLFINGYNIISIALEDFFWQYCFQFTKYKYFIKKHGTSLNTEKVNDKNYLLNGYQRVKYYVNGDENFLNFFKSTSKYIAFIFWFSYSFIFNKNKIWIDKSFLKNLRYKNFIIKNKSKYLVIPFAFESHKTRSKNIEDAFIKDAKKKIGQYKKWIFAIKYLYPKKILLSDNAYNNFSILLAAKIMGTKCEAICHSVNIKYHMNTMGTDIIQNKNLLLYDKIYVYNDDFKDFVIKNGSFYKSKKIGVVGWINDKSYNFGIKKNYSNKYLLYAFEHFCNYHKINKFLKFFHKKNHKILIKKRPDMENYGHFDKDLNIEFVDDFTKSQIKDSICALGSTTSLLFNLSQNYIPIVYIKNDGLNNFNGFNYPKNWVVVDNINNSIYKKISNLSINKKYRLDR